MLRKILNYIFALSFALVACGEDPPSLPPPDSLEFINFEKGQSSALSAATGEGTTANVEQAAGAVFFVTFAVNAYLTVPRLVFAATLTEEPTKEGDFWTWQHTFPLAGWEASLQGKAAEKLELAMHITGLRADTDWVKDFIWFSGSHAQNEGVWQIFDPGTKAQAGPVEAVVQIDWARTSQTEKELLFTNIRSGSPKLNDKINFWRRQNLASLEIHDEKSGPNDDQAAADFSVVWNLVSGAGQMTKVSGEKFCWDTLENGQVDIVCPTGDWPLP